MEDFIAYLPLILLFTLIIIAMIKSNYEKDKICENYEIIIWDEHESFYVVRDPEKKTQYILEPHLFRGFTFRPATIDFSKIRH